VRSGTSTPAAAALFAASGPATPSIAPSRPNSARFGDRRRSIMYERNVGISDPPAGSAPIGKPRSVPRSHGFQDRCQSSRVIHAPPDRGFSRSSPPP
jgi:hypothetical protein